MSNSKGAGGRPTKYDKKYCKEIIEFFDRKAFEPLFDKEGEPVLNRSGSPIMVPVELPTFEAFAHSIDVHKDTIYQWAEVHEEFSDAKKRAQQLQHNIWVQNGLNSSYNSTFAIFFGKACLGMRDGNEADQEAPKPVQITFNVEDGRVRESEA